VVLEPVEASERQSAGSPEIRVVMKNQGPGCRPLFVTGTYLDAPAERPATLLEFEIADTNGRRVEPAVSRSVVRPRFTLADLVLLHCGVSYSWDISLGTLGWGYHLQPGRYEVQARVRNRVAEFFDRHPAQRERFTAAFELDPAFGDELLLDFDSTSNKVVLVVGP